MTESIFTNLSNTASGRRPWLLRVGSDIWLAWGRIFSEKPLVWLRPAPWVRVHLPDGSTALCQGVDGPLQEDNGRITRFNAVCLHVDGVLERRVQFPLLSGADRDELLALEVSQSSPFSAQDTVASFRKLGHLDGDTTVLVETWAVTITSKDHLQQALGKAAAAKSATNLLGETSNEDDRAWEVWFAGDERSPRQVFASSGGAARATHEKRWQTANVLLLAVVVCLLVGAVITPAAQLYLKAVDADRQHVELASRVAPIVGQRDSLMQSAKAVQTLQAAVGQSVDLMLLTDRLSATLPDHTFLKSLQVQGQKVTIVGETSNATELMQTLGVLPGIKEVKAPSASTRLQGTGREAFTIEFTAVEPLLKPLP